MRRRVVFFGYPVECAAAIFGGLAVGGRAALGTTYYVSPGGSDSNSGTSAGSPWATVTQVDTTTFQPGDEILFQAGGNWYGNLQASSTGSATSPIVYGSYGTGANPTFWGSNVVGASSFQPVSGAADTYTYSTPTTVNSFFENDKFSVSAALASGQTTDSGNISYVESTPNTWYYSTSAQKLYVNTGSAVSGGNTYSVAVRQSAIDSNSQSNLVFQNLTTNETAAYNGGYGINIFSSNNVTVNNCQALNGGKHNVGVIDSTATLNNVLAEGVMPDQGVGGATAFVSYSDYRFTGNSSVYNNCTVANYPGEPAFYDHADNAAALTAVTLNNFTSMGSPIGIGLGSGDHAQINGGLIVNASLGLGGQTTVDGMRVAGPAGYIALSGSNNLIQNTVLTGSVPTNPYVAAIVDQGQNDVVRNSTILLSPSAPSSDNAIEIVDSPSDFSAYANVIAGPTQTLQAYYQFTASPNGSQPNTFKLAYNVYLSGANGEFVDITGLPPLTLAQMQALGLDTGSVNGTPVFFNSATGQYELVSGSPGVGLVPLNSMTQGVLYDYTGAARPQSGYDNAGAFGANSVGTADASINATWNGLNVGSWSEGFNWSGGTPGVAGNTVNFDALEYGATTVSLDGSWTVGTINFNNSQGYTITPGGGGTLTLNNNGPAAQIDVISGNHMIAAPVTLASNVTIASGPVGSVLTISGNISGGGGITMASTGTAGNMGTVVLAGLNSYSGGTNVTGGTLLVGAGGALPVGPLAISGGVVQLGANTGVAKVTSLAISGNGELDLTNNAMILSYTGNSPISTIVQEIRAGYNGGAWNGAGILSTLLQNGGGSQYGIGYADSADPGNPAGLAPGEIEFRYTLLGDANLDGKVNGTDFNILAANFNTGGDSWDQGDFNYDGKVNGADFNYLAENFNQGVGPAQDLAALDALAAANGFLANVPEPASFGAMIFGGVMMVRRRRVSRYLRR